MGSVVLDLPVPLLVLLQGVVPLGLVVSSFAARSLARLLGHKSTEWIRGPQHFDDRLPSSGKRGWRSWSLSVLACVHVLLVLLVLASTLYDRLYDLSWRFALLALVHIFQAVQPLASPSDTVPYLLFNTFVLQTVFGLLWILKLVIRNAGWQQASFIAAYIAITTLELAVTFTYRMELPLTDSEANGKNVSPEDSVRFGSWVVFSWVKPLIAKGSKTKLGYEDVWDLATPMRSENVAHEAEEITGNLIWRIWWLNRLDMTVSLSLGLLDAGLSYVAPFFLNQILSSLSAGATPEQRISAYVYATLAFLAGVIKAEIILQQLWHERRAISRTRAWLTDAIYVKALKRRDTSGIVPVTEDKPKTNANDNGGKKKKKEETATSGSTGRIVQLMSNDTQRVAMQLMTLSSTVSAPFELLVAVGFLYQLLGWTAFAGLAAMLIFLPFNNMLVRRRIRIHRNVLAARDKRMDILNEYIQAIRFVKYSASESQWLERVHQARENELGWLLKTRLNNMLINAIWGYSPDLIMLIAFALFVGVRGQQLTVPIAFTSVALFNLLRGPMNMLPSAITNLLQTYVSIQRLEAFFGEPEVEGWVSAFRSSTEERSTKKVVSISNGHFQYRDVTSSATAQKPADVKSKVQAIETPAEAATPEQGSSTPQQQPSTGNVITVVEQTAIENDHGKKADESFELRDIDVTFPRGKLTLICGPTSSGKSSLLSALLGEMDRIEGVVSLPKDPPNAVDAEGLYEGVAFCAQLPWLQHASIKDNILFGSTYEESRYESVLDACALRPDLDLFDAGDMTEIGEKGISLSGGQKARVALARAVYSRARLVLLDDPLSAVDSHTARHIFDKCIRGPLLSNRTVVLITHHVTLTLSQADHVVEMASGKITFQGDAQGYGRYRGISSAEIKEDQAKEETVQEVAPDADLQGAKDNVKSAQLRPKNDGKLVQEEARATGQVRWAVYRTYLSSAGWESWLILLLLLLGGRAFVVLDRWFFKVWGESYEQISLYLEATRTQIALLMQPTVQSDPTHDNFHQLIQLPPASVDVRPYVAIYALIGLGSLGIFMLTTLASFRGSFKAARKLFKRTIVAVTNATFRYFDTTPTGRILNRFSADFQVIDMSITDQLRMCLTRAFNFVVNVGVVILVSPAFMPPAALLIFVYVRLSLSYVRCSRDLRRLESNARSPIFSKFGETLTGIVTCRAFGAERRFLKQLHNQVDTFLSAQYTGTVVSRYLLFRFDLLGATGVAITTYLALSAKASPGLAALAITSAQMLVQNVYWLCRLATQVEVDLNAVERVTELLDVPQEPPSVIESKRPPAIWPSDQGGIEFDNVTLSYAPTLPPVLHRITFSIAPRQKVGIVGRTGSSKSTMAMSLFRFVDPSEGRIIIDGIDITSIGLHDLRSRLTLIPQEAVLFSGTVRSNLDPFEEHSDEECLEALARVHLAVTQSRSGSAMPSQASSRSASPSPAGRNQSTNGTRHDEVASSAGSTAVDTLNGRTAVSLSMPVSPQGGNFSAGQRQLLALARALLKRSRIIVMDESTASVDFETDEKIQRTIQEEFADSLVLCIAHRLMTVIRYDKILVLDAGKVVEFDTPQDLLRKSNGHFRQMCEQAADWPQIRSLVLGE